MNNGCREGICRYFEGQTEDKIREEGNDAHVAELEPVLEQSSTPGEAKG